MSVCRKFCLKRTTRNQRVEQKVGNFLALSERVEEILSSRIPGLMCPQLQHDGPAHTEQETHISVSMVATPSADVRCT